MAVPTFGGGEGGRREGGEGGVGREKGREEGMVGDIERVYLVVRRVCTNIGEDVICLFPLINERQSDCILHIIREPRQQHLVVVLFGGIYNKRI